MPRFASDVDQLSADVDASPAVPSSAVSRKPADNFMG